VEGAFSFGRNMNNRKYEARTERQQQRVEAGFMAEHFPEVTGIVISMMYKQKGVAKALVRTINFFPESYAFFIVDCLSKECVDGGFDLTRVITEMIGNHRENTKGELGCEGSGTAAEHSTIVYDVAIKYV
jgi:hypothetical protein